MSYISLTASFIFPTIFDSPGDELTIFGENVDYFTISKLTAGWFTKKSTANMITYASITPTMNPNILEGIPSIIVKLSIFSNTPVAFIIIAKSAENKDSKSKNGSIYFKLKVQ